MKYRKIDLDEVLSQIDMESWLDREGVEYNNTFGSSGEQLNVQTCPNCGDDRWKVYLNAETGLGNCFVCGGPNDKGFNKWSFIKASLGLGNGQVIEHLKQVAKETGWMPKRIRSNATSIEKAKLILPLSVPIPIKGKNLKYLAMRRIGIEYAEYFQLRYCQEGGFYYKGLEGKSIYQNYKQRIIIPVFDIDGELASFQGRDITNIAINKYLFPPGYAATGKLLYNSHNARRAKRVVIGEGVFDVIATKIALDNEVYLRDVVPIGTFGKHLSYGHGDGTDQLGMLIKLKSEGLEEVTFMWDGSVDAIDAAIDAALMVSSIGLRARVAILPKDKDPNEVTSDVVISAFYRAKMITPIVAAKMKVNNK